MRIKAPGYTLRKFNLRDKSTRESLRRRVISKFLNEAPGTKYLYVVEKLQGGGRFYLTRPTYRYGFDFQLWVENWTRGRDGRPSISEIRDDLAAKKQTNPTHYALLYQAIVRVHGCEDPEIVLQSFPGVSFQTGLSVETILKILKWLFIEQDITYWNGEGRNKLKRAIDKI